MNNETEQQQQKEKKNEKVDGRKKYPIFDIFNQPIVLTQFHFSIRQPDSQNLATVQKCAQSKIYWKKRTKIKLNKKFTMVAPVAHTLSLSHSSRSLSPSIKCVRNFYFIIIYILRWNIFVFIMIWLRLRSLIRKRIDFMQEF